MIARVIASVAFVLCSMLAGGIWSARAAGPADPSAMAAPLNTSLGTSAGATRRPASPESGEDIRDIHGPMAIPRPQSGWWYVAEAAILGATIAAFLVRGRRRKPALPAHERALRAIAGARALVGGDAREFSFVAAETVRVYLEEKFQIRAPHRTTEELLADLMTNASPVAAHRAKLGEFLSYCDLAKFGGWSLSRADMEAMVASAETFIRATATPLSSSHVRRTELQAGGVG